MNQIRQMECRDIIASLSDYLDGQSGHRPSLTAVDITALEAHLADCPNCQIVKIELTELRLAARDLPLHTPPIALWTRVSNIVAAEVAPQQRPTREEFPPESFWERLRARRFSFNLPQLAGVGVLAIALLTASIYFFRPTSPALNLSNAQTSLLPEEREVKAELDRRAAALTGHQANWSAQQRADFAAELARIEASLNRCRQHLQANAQDPIQQQLLRTLYEEKRLLLADAERLK